MADSVQCGGCGKRYAIRPEMAGKRTRCKGCGTVIVIPKVDDIDPFDLSSLADLEAAAGAEAHASAIAPANPGPSARPAAANASPRSRKPAAVAAPSAPQVVNYGAAAQPADPFVNIPGADIIDRWLPWAPIVIFLAFLLMLAARGISTAFEMAEVRHVPDEIKWRAVGYVTGRLFGIAAVFAGVFAPLCLLGVFIASRVMRFENPRRLYLRCLAVVCAPLALIFAVNGFDIDLSMLVLPWWVLVLTMGAFLWLLLRLKPVPFLVAGSLGVGFAIAIPVIMNLQYGPRSQPPRSYATAAPPPSPSWPNPSANPGPGQYSPPPTPPQPDSVAIAVPVANPAAERSRVEGSMRKLADAIRRHRQAHNDQFPGSIDEMVSAGLLSEGDRRGNGWQLVYRPDPRLNASLPDFVMIAHDVHSLGDKRQTLLFINGRVDSVDADAFIPTLNRSDHAISGAKPVAVRAQPVAPPLPADPPANRPPAAEAVAEMPAVEEPVAEKPAPPDKPAASKRPPATPPPKTGKSPGEYALGQRVEILWGSKWYAGKIIAREGQLFRVHYDGWSKNFDEAVPGDRLRKTK